MARNAVVLTDYLKVAQGGVYEEPTAVRTVLGSCVAATFFVPARRVGAIFHAFLPYAADYRSDLPAEAYKFVDTAIATVMRRFTRLGIKPAHIQVKLAGGANGIIGEAAGVGAKNVQAAYNVLSDMGLRVVSADVGGAVGRKLVYFTGTGELYISYLSKPYE